MVRILEMKKQNLDQEDYFNNEYIEKVSEKYSQLMGLFIIKFSELEHEINQAIAKSFIDDDDSEGYHIIKFLNTNSRIELFYEIYLERASLMDLKIKPKLKNMKKDLDAIRTFRNKLVHANWPTLDKSGYVRTEMKSDKEEGIIKLIHVKILPSTIRSYISLIDSTIIKIWDYLENEQ